MRKFNCEIKNQSNFLALFRINEKRKCSKTKIVIIMNENSYQFKSTKQTKKYLMMNKKNSYKG